MRLTVLLIAALLVAGAHGEEPGAKGEEKKEEGGKTVGGAVSSTDTKCVICQYMVERIHGEMLMQGVGGSLPFGQTPPMVGTQRAAHASAIRAGPPGEKATTAPAQLFTPPVPNTGANNAPAGEAVNPGLEGGETNVAGFIEEGETPTGPGEQPTTAPDSKRLRELMLRKFRPAQVRYSNMYDGPLRAAKRAQDRFENNQVWSFVYQKAEAICATQMPKSFYLYCADILKSYQKVSEGLIYKDRPDAICMHINACEPDSYLAKGPHSDE